MPATGHEPSLGGAGLITGMEPAVSQGSAPRYGSLRIRGLEAPPVIGRHRPLVVLALLDESISELVQFIMEANGYDIRCADDGEHAVGLVRALEPNLLVSSLRLARCSGTEVIRRVRADTNLLVQRVPTLVIDVQIGPRPVAGAFAAGADDYVAMPVELPVMLRAWQRALGSLVRPAPLTAVLNEDTAIRDVALRFAEQQKQRGLARGLGELLWQPDAQVRRAVWRVLARLGTDEARAVLEDASASGVDAGQNGGGDQRGRA